jgi:hypothetical protein
MYVKLRRRSLARTVINVDTQKICDRMIGLKDTCIHPQTQKPYMRSYGGGKNNSPEGAAVSLLV